MGRKVARLVSAQNKSGERRWFSPGDEVPDEFAASITNPVVWADDDGTPDEDAAGTSDDDEGDPTPGGDGDDDSGDQGDPDGDAGDDEDEDPEPQGDDAWLEENYPHLETNDALRAELAERDVAVHGNKAELIARLRADDEDFDGE